MNWFHRGEERYVEYGSSLSATRAFGIVRSLFDTVYNMNMAHLTRARRTVFEHLDDAGLRTACTTYLIYRGRTRHEPSRVSVYSRLAEAAQFNHAVYAAGELFYADLFDSRGTGCSSTLGLPGQRDQHTGCVGEFLVERDLFDFLLFSLPDNDTYSHKHGPDQQPTSIAEADRALTRLVDAGGGLDLFLDEYAVIVMSDHSQTIVEERINLAEVLSASRVLMPGDAAPTEADIAVCPAARSAMVYVLDASRREELVERVVGDLREVEGVDLLVTREDGGARVWSARGELWFGPAGAAAPARGSDPERAASRGPASRRARGTLPVADRRGGSWRIEGDLETLGLTVDSGRVESVDYPDALTRLWSAVECRQSGDVLISATLGYEFADWGGADHVGGGSHGSLHREDSEGVLLTTGIDLPKRESWALTDVTPLVLSAFDVPWGR
jgi:hypothetical protein